MFSLSRLLSWPHRGKCDWTISRPHAYPPSNIPAPASQSPATRAAHTRGARPVPSRGRNQHRVASPGPEMLIGRSDAATPPRAHSSTPLHVTAPRRAPVSCVSQRQARAPPIPSRVRESPHPSCTRQRPRFAAPVAAAPSATGSRCRPSPLPRAGSVDAGRRESYGGALGASSAPYTAGEPSL